MSRRWRIGLAGLLVGLVAFFAPVLPEVLEKPEAGRSWQLLDRHGRLLREVLSPRAGLDDWVTLDEVAPELVAAFLVSEDERFWWHPGLDPMAIARAAWANFRAGRAVQGGSTITQQLVRNLRSPRQRSWSHKLGESYYALRLEARMTKAAILECYLNRISFGNQCLGVEAASQLYFAKTASQLSLAQAAFLAVIPRSPSTLDPYTPDQKEAIERLSGQLLERMLAAGRVTREEVEIALAEPIVIAPFSHRFEAGHFCDLVLDREPSGPVVKTSLDLELQHQVEGLVRAHLASLQDHRAEQAAAVVLKVETGEVLALVGSADYFDFASQGQVNAAIAARQPGSTLKPFTYSVALEWGETAASLLPDIDLYPAQQGESFIPKNYDSRFHGPVRLRTALACSYNVPAVRALEKVGVERLLRRLHALGFAHLQEDPIHYGLGLTLGDGEATLLELTNAYRALARSGQHSPWRWAPGQPSLSRQVINPEVAFLITDILSDDQARVPAFGGEGPLDLPFPCAAKTGTSKGYRDNWTIGYTPRYAVGVWVGNFGGEPMVDVSGVTGAGPLFRDIVMLLGDGGSFSPPASLRRLEVCPQSGMRPSPDCPHTMLDWFQPGTEPSLCNVHRVVEGRLYTVFPPLYWDWMVANDLPLPPQDGPLQSGLRLASPQQGAVFQLDPVLRPAYQKVLLKAVLPEGTRRVEWYVDNRLVSEGTGPRAWWPMRRGEHHAYIIAHGSDASLQSETVTFFVR